jgi:uncharacterized membrane protein
MKSLTHAGRGLVACAVTIGIFAALLFLTSPTDGDFWWFDASRHAMNGVFVRDFFLEGGLLHPVDYARRYYLQYPGINIGFYPPFFYLTAAPFLAVFGASHAVVQAVVALYALAAGLLAYLIAARTMPRIPALATALCILGLPEMSLWSRQVQPDVPAVALLLATAYLLIRHLENGKAGWLWATSLCLGLAMLTRVQVMHAIPVVGLLLLAYRGGKYPSFKVKAWAAMLLAALSFPSLAATLYFSRTNQALAQNMPDMPGRWTLGNWTWYAEQLPGQMGWPALVFTIAGLIAAGVSYRQNKSVASAVAAAFCLGSWIFFSVVSNKDPRFNLPSLPFLFLVASMGLAWLMPRAARVALPLLALWLAVQALWVTEVPVARGFKEAALLSASLAPKNANTLISAHRDGSYIFDMRTMAGRRDIGIRRADKLFVEIDIMRELGIKDRNLDQAAIARMLQSQNVAVIVAQAGYLSDQPTMRNFQALLDAGQLYEKVRVIPMTGKTRPDERELVVYKRK